MKVMIVAVGTPKSEGLATAIHEYESRVQHYFKLDVVELKAERIGGAADAARVAAAEGESLLQRIPSELELVALDRRGVPWSSEELAAYMEDISVHGKPGVAFVVGGALGLSPELLQRANRILSLSGFTLPHELARLVLAEQIYRAGTIVRGEPYHK